MARGGRQAVLNCASQGCSPHMSASFIRGDLIFCVAPILPARGACEVFSTLRTFRDDLTAHPPDHFVCVPLVLDTLYSKVRTNKPLGFSFQPACSHLTGLADPRFFHTPECH